MILQSTIKSECLQVETIAKDREEILRVISRLAKASDVLNDYTEETIFQALLKREEVGTTGFGGGVALPHCSFPGLKEFVVGLLVAKDGVDFQALDGKKSKLFFFIIGPEEERNRHIQILSSISRLIKSPDRVKELIKAKSNEGLLAVIGENSEVAGEFVEQKERVLFHVFVQVEKYFEEILQIFSGLDDVSLSVIETMNAGHYLYSLPLFSTFWSEEKKQYSRIIMATVDKRLANNVIRKINATLPNIEKSSGVMVTVNELFYTNGSLDF